MDEALAEPADEALARWGSYARTVREIYDWDRIADEYLSAYRGD
jgi:glycosyltransferase involved in cell wall biosynthesis